ncbi:hypothetical protein CEP53_005390 [Fusarium sp. AF-6]|nr:hypothetical protein CEP53_005390 [Fusarium sp. AF-6]
MTHDNSFPVITKFMEMGATSVNNNRQVVMTLDHDVQNNSESNLPKYRLIEEFANKHGIDFYPAKHGIGHQIMIEEAIVRSDAASVLATSTIFWKVPPIAKIIFTGTLPPGVTGKDTIIALCALLGSDVLNMCVEFTGSKQTLASIPISERLTIANMTTEMGSHLCQLTASD